MSDIFQILVPLWSILKLEMKIDWYVNKWTDTYELLYNDISEIVSSLVQCPDQNLQTASKWKVLKVVS
jgi:hypothetical protein